MKCQSIVNNSTVVEFAGDTEVARAVAAERKR